jgi:signal transduction histidine kinase
VVVHAWHQDTDVYYTVADQGIGISEDDLEKIWDRLWRSADERVREIPGGGIGLAFARSIIKRHGGSISVESDLNEGSTFTFSLPLTQGS